MIDISIIIVSWNCKQMLADCIRSIQPQLASGITEIVVVDNASKDGTPEMIREEFPSVDLIANSTNVGFAEGNNQGLKLSRGQYVCLINPDVVVGKYCIGGMLEFLKQHREIGMIGPQILGADGSIQRSCMQIPTLWNQFCRASALDRVFKYSRLFGGYLMADFSHDVLRDVDVINGCFWMVTRKALGEVGCLDSRFWLYGEDVDWCHRFHLAGWRVVFFPQAQAVHYGGGSSRHASLFCYLQMQRADLQYWRKYHGRVSYACYWMTLFIAHCLRSLAFSFIYCIDSFRRKEALEEIRKHVFCVQKLMGYFWTAEQSSVFPSSLST